MKSHSQRNRSRSISALIFLTFIGSIFLLVSVVAIICGFVINFHEDFEAATLDADKYLESTIKAQFDYSQYWLGFPFLLTSILSITLGTCQNTRSLTTTTMMFFLLSIVLALFAIVLEGVDWVYWKNLDREQRYWDNKDGYQCFSNATLCRCTSTDNKIRYISEIASCSNIASLSGLYGGIVASAITGLSLSLAGIVVILKTFSWKPRGHLEYREYNVQKLNPVQYYDSSYENKPYEDKPYEDKPYEDKPYENGFPLEEVPSLAGATNSTRPTHGWKMGN